MPNNQSPNPRHSIGRQAEAGAARWVEARGGVILARNYFAKGGELDLVAEWYLDLVFIEVRARITAVRWVDPEQTVTFPKQLRIERAARQFLSSYQGRATGIRFDILAWDGSFWKHLPRAWR